MGNRDFTEKKINIESVCSDYIFTDTAFLKKYVYYLEKYSDNNFLKILYDSLNPSICYYEELLNNEYPFYNYDSLFITNNAKKIREELPEYKNRIIVNPDYSRLDYEKYFSDIVYRETDYLMLAPYYVVAYMDKITNKVRINIINYFNNDVEIVGYGNDNTGTKSI